MSFKKIDKEFCITDNSVNCYGYRLLTEGFQMDCFNPPIGYFMHERDKGVAVRWSDFRIDGDKVFAKPTINILQFPDLVGQIEDGFYQSASVGHIIALEWTDEPAQKLKGQTGITVTKWFCRECSIVDIPGNFNATADLYDKDDKSLKNLISKPQQMKPRKPQEDKYTKNPTTSNSLENSKEVALPEKYKDKSYTDLWMSGDLECLKKMHPLYVKRLQEESKVGYEKEKSRGVVAKDRDVSTKRTPSDTSLPEQFRNKTKQELFYNGGLSYLKAHHPNIFNDLVSN